MLEVSIDKFALDLNQLLKIFCVKLKKKEKRARLLPLNK